MPADPAPSAEPPLPFSHIGPYAVLSRLGEGGMGEVYLARSPGGRKVAVKTIRPEFLAAPQFRARFRVEAAAARRVSGAFTAPVIDADADARIPWLATAYVPAPTLSRLVASQGPLTGPELRRLAAGAAEALGSVHAAGVLHRDLKPSNIMMADDGPRLIDFGIAQALVPEPADSGQRLGLRPIGTAGYIAPELLAGDAATAAADVFSFGAALCFAATGTGPYGTGPAEVVHLRVSELEPDLSGIEDPLIAIITGYCLARDPAARPGVADILGLLDGRPFTPPAPAGPDPEQSGGLLGRLRTAPRAAVLGGGAGVVALILGATLALTLPGAGGSGSDGSDFAWTLAPSGVTASMLGLWGGTGEFVVGTQTGGLKSYAAATGATGWSWSPPSGDAVCAMSQDTSAGLGAVVYGPANLDGIMPTCDELQVLNVRTGRPGWSAPVGLSATSGATPDQNGVRALSINGGLVTAPYFATADESAGTGTDTDVLVASAGTGKTAWTTDFGANPLPDGCTMTGTATLFGSTVYTLGECDGGSRTDLFSLGGAAAKDAKDLGTLGQCENASSVAGDGFLSADAEELLIDCPGGVSSSGLYALPQASTKLVRIGSVAPPPAATGGIAGYFSAPGGLLLSGTTLYFASPRSGSNAAAVTAVSLTDGSREWTQPFAGAAALVPLTASSAGVEIVADDGGSTGSQLVALNAATGKPGTSRALGATPTDSFDSFTSGTELPYAVAVDSSIAIAFPETMMSGGRQVGVLSSGG